MMKFKFLCVAACLLASCGNDTTEEIEAMMSTRTPSQVMDATFGPAPAAYAWQVWGCTVNHGINSCQHYIAFRDATKAAGKSVYQFNVDLENDEIYFTDNTGVETARTTALHTHTPQWTQDTTADMEVTCNYCGESCADLPVIRTYLATEAGTTVDQVARFHVTGLFKDASGYRLLVRVEKTDGTLYGSVNLPITYLHASHSSTDPVHGGSGSGS